MSFSSSLLFTDIFKMNLTSYWLGLSGINCFNYLSYDLWQGLSVPCFCPDVLNTNLRNDWCYRKCLVYIYIYIYITLSYYVMIILVFLLLFSFIFIVILLLVLLSLFKFHLILCCICCVLSPVCVIVFIILFIIIYPA